MTKVAQVSAVANNGDPRIVFRTAYTLAPTYDVTLVMPSNGTEAQLKQKKIPRFKNLWLRILLSHPIILVKCIGLNAKIYHFHSPELIPIMLILKALGKTIVFDIHENTYQQIARKPKHNSPFLQKAFAAFDLLAQAHFNLIFAEISYQRFYQKGKKMQQVVLNYPNTQLLSKFEHNNPSIKQSFELFYIGGISFDRCIDTIVAAVLLLRQKFPAIKIHLIGDVYESQKAISQLPNYSIAAEHLIFHGKLEHNKAFAYSKNAVAGLALLKATPNYYESYPCKIFEYMSIGLPVICSNFPLYIPVVENNKCGLCIDATNANLLAQSISYLFENRQHAFEMGLNGIKAVQSTYNWQQESKKLINFYQKLNV